MALFIDGHSHIFNWRHVPVEGFFRSKPFLGKAAAAWLTDLVQELARHPELVEKLREALEHHTPRAAVLDSILQHLARRATVEEARAGVEAIVTQGLGAAISDGQAAEAEGEPSELRANLLFVLNLLAETATIAEHLVRGTYELEPEAPEALPRSYFVTLMMDMGLAHTVTRKGAPIPPDQQPRPPALPYPEQIREMVELGKAYRGRLLSFVAFDPRREDALARVEQALNEGMVGVKLYPPMGYRPLDADHRESFRALYAFCCEHDVPVMAHCTAHGFEAYPGHGVFSEPSSRRDPAREPQGWDVVLKEFGTLRLCLGHTGGAGFHNRRKPGGPAGRLSYPGWCSRRWRSRLTVRRNYALDVVRLCVDHPNVYADLSYLHEIVGDDTRRGRLDRHLREVLAREEDRGDHPLVSKLMYGSDWHMPDVAFCAQQLREALAEVWAGLEADGLAASADFFGTNALRFLNLRGSIQRLRHSSDPALQRMVATWGELLDTVPGL